MKTLNLLLMLIALPCMSDEQRCHYPSKSDGGSHLGADDCGTINSGVIVLKDKYFKDLRFDENNLACIYFANDGVFYIHKDKKSIKALAYDNGCDYFEEGLARAEVNGKTVFINHSLEVVLEPDFEFISTFHYGHVVVCNGISKDDNDAEHPSFSGGKCGLMNKKGDLVVEAIHPIEDRNVFKDYINNNSHCDAPPITTEKSALCHAKRHVSYMRHTSSNWQSHKLSKFGDIWLVSFIEKNSPHGKKEELSLTLDANNARWKSLVPKTHSKAFLELSNQTEKQ